MYLTVTITIISPKTNQNIWFIFYSDQGSIPEVYDALVEDGCLYGERVYTDTRGSLTVERNREEMILGKPSVLTVRPCHIVFTPSENIEYVKEKT